MAGDGRLGDDGTNSSLRLLRKSSAIQAQPGRRLLICLQGKVSRSCDARPKTVETWPELLLPIHNYLLTEHVNIIESLFY